ncbi:hypothetical protein OG912_03060 [Streptomyces sp. NBC_00464]|uniref:hypothetical protein n=1 Tax=Streptomyces sp. NBC_00464 TaxID=2975751 RepID=UPI002E197B33
MGGFIAQVIAAEEPDLVRKLILAGAGPAGGPGIDKVTSVTVQDMLRATLRRKDPKHYLFFTRTEGGRRAAREFLARLKERTDDHRPGCPAAPRRTRPPLPRRRTRRDLPEPRPVRPAST